MIITEPASDDPMVARLLALRKEAEEGGHQLLAYLIDVALAEAERLVENRQERRP